MPNFKIIKPTPFRHENQSRTFLHHALRSAAISGSLHAASIPSGSLTLVYDQTKFGLQGPDQHQPRSINRPRTPRQRPRFKPTLAPPLRGPASTTASINYATHRSDRQKPPGNEFTYNPSDLTGPLRVPSASAARPGGTWIPSLGGGVSVLGDFTVQYDASRAGGVYSARHLTNNFSPRGLAFHLANVTTNVLGDGFTLSGDLYVKTGPPLNLSLRISG